MEQRKIRFKAWDEVDKKMVEITAFNFVDGYGKPVPSVIKVIYKDGKKFYDAMSMSVILLQFIGLKDRYGKEIYEGDILRRIGGSEIKEEYEYYIVEIKDQRFAYPMGKPNEWSDIFKLDEVVGNIYENPELLKEAIKE